MCASVSAFPLLWADQAYRRFFAKKAKHPRFKKKGRCRDSFCAARDEGSVVFEAGRVRLPLVGAIKFRTPIRWSHGRIKRATVYRQANQWFMSVLYDLPEPKPRKHRGPSAGIDLGMSTFATVASKGVIVDEVKPPKPYAKAKRRLKRLGRAVSRKVKGSKNRQKAIHRLARQHSRVRMVRCDFLHKLSRRLVNTYGVICLETVSITGWGWGKGAGSLKDLALGEFRRQMEYKAAERGTKLVFADRLFPSTKRCSACGFVNPAVALGMKEWDCPECGSHHHRDQNAALNLEQLPRGTGKVTPAKIGVPAKRKPSRSRSLKREHAQT